MKLFIPEHILDQDPERTYRDIRALLDRAGPDDDVWYARWWAADALTLMGDYSAAISIYPPPNLQRASMQVERLLSLKILAGHPYAANDLLALVGPRVTKYGRERIELVRQAVEVLIAADPVEYCNLRLGQWAEKAPQREYQVYLGSAAGYRATQRLA